MNKVIKGGAFITAVIAISLTGTTVSFAAEAQTPVVKKIAFTAEQKAAFQEARTEFKAARQAAIATAKAAIATAKSNFDSAKAAATTKEDRQAVRAAFKAAVTAAIASVPAKPVLP